MLKRFYPNEYVNDVEGINYNRLKELGIKGLIYDLDNTLSPFDIEKPTDNIIKLINKLKGEGFKICLVSNNKGNRVKIYNEELGLPSISKAGKPKTGCIKKAKELLNLKNDEIVIIGDQMFTDIWVGNRAGIMSILVKPIAGRDEFTVRLKRGVESKVLKKYIKSINKSI